MEPTPTAQELLKKAATISTILDNEDYTDKLTILQAVLVVTVDPTLMITANTALVQNYKWE